MTRFLALVWDVRDALGVQQALAIRQSVLDARTWATVTDRAGLAVYLFRASGAPQPAIALHQDAGVILGTLFKRSTSATNSTVRQWTIEAQQTRDVQKTRGRSLIDSNWGSYVLFLRRDEEHLINVFRGPAGSLACYYLNHQRCTVLVTHPADLQSLCPGLLSINWDSIRAQAAAGDYLTRETGLTEIAAVLSGECLDIHEGRVTHRSYWNPSKLCTNAVASLPEATALLHRETHSCISAWASLHDTVLLLLSGGLDSSIVLSCLRTPPAPARVIAVNFYSAGAGDERRYARSMADRTQVQLEEVPSNLNIDLRDFRRCSMTPSPVLNFTAFDVEPVMHRLARTWNATAIFTGETGDDVFGHAPTPEALAEILQCRDQIRRFFAASMDFAELSRISVWRAMHLAFQYLQWLRRIETWSVYRHRQLAGHSRASSLLTQEAADEYEAMIPRFLHPWFQEADGMPLGKAMLIYSVVKATSSASHSPSIDMDAAPTINPLVSQPLIEAALRIPSYMHFTRAENGAVARAAFNSALSPEVLERGTGKGSPTAWARGLLDNNAGYLSELLLDGLLVQKSILDRAKIETLLSKDISRTRLGMAELVRQVYIEMWLRQWAQEGARL